MATVENVHLAITASTTKPGYSDIAYSYELHPSELDCAWKREYTMSAVLCGKDVIGDDEVYLTVEARSGLRPDAAGESMVMGKSNIVIGDF